MRGLAWRWGLLFAICISPAWGQDDDDDDIQPGLILTREFAGESTRQVAGDVSLPLTSAADDRSPAGTPLTRTWQGSLLLKSEGTFQFHAYVHGTIRVQVGETVVLDAHSPEPGWVSGPATEFSFGDFPFTAQFQKGPQPGSGLKLYWSGDGFPLEPLPHHLLFHEVDSRPMRQARTGAQQLVAANCLGCHAERSTEPALPRYALTHVGAGRSWPAIRERLMRREPSADQGRMPAYGLSAEEAAAVVAYLAQHTQKLSLKEPARVKVDPKSTPRGRELIKSVGCLACHEWQGVGQLPPLGGGKLDGIGTRRSRAWLHAWLSDPATIHPQHRMPVFSLSPAERQQIVDALVGEKPYEPREQDAPQTTKALVTEGRRIIDAARCVVCHDIPGDVAPQVTAVVNQTTQQPVTLSFAAIQAGQGCLSDAPLPERYRPSFAASSRDSLAAAFAPGIGRPRLSDLERNGCINCHDRDGQRGLSNLAVTLLKSEPEWQGQTPTLSPPPLTAVGDRLQDASLQKAVAGELPVRLPWLRVRMPKFRGALIASIPQQLIAADRIPDGAPATIAYPVSRGNVPPETLLAGRELTGGKGFSCVACHQLKDYVPPKVALGTRGSDLYQLGLRMREPYFFRWTSAPLRILPGVEMPSYQRPHPTILAGDMQRQLAAIWDALHDPQFTAPTNPAVVEQLWGPSTTGAPRILRDVFTLPTAGGQVHAVPRAFAVGFANRHNALFDLETASLRAWTIGDFARQRTQGKSWFWDLAGVPVAAEFPAVPDVSLFDTQTGQIVGPETGWQTQVRLLQSAIVEQRAVEFQYELTWSRTSEPLPKILRVNERWEGIDNGWKRGIRLGELPAGHTAWLRRPSLVQPFGQPTIRVESGDWGRPAATAPEGLLLRTDHDPSPAGWLHYQTEVAPPQVEAAAELLADPVPTQSVTCLPGFQGTRLPLPQSIMPTALAWDDRQQLVFTSLKGHVYRALDADRDGLPERLELVAEGLSAPYGIFAEGSDLLVSHKPEVVRLCDTNGDGVCETTRVIATGWGFTDDYHDWTCGIVRDTSGKFYVGLGSDYSHKNRPPSESRWRGNILQFDLEGHLKPIATGLRYATGLTMLPGDRLLVSDQQGVQNCFNELNLIQVGKRYGVPAQLDPRDDVPAEAAAVQIPHPWTRSVNGIAVWPGNEHPFSGQVVGVEFNERFLIRASLQEVDGVTQGAVYPLSLPGTTNRPDELLGPLCVAFSPRGELYVGSIHDSGWMGGLNTGDLVRFVPAGELPNGIREVQATPRGFAIEFLRPIDPVKGADPSQYKLSGYTRVWEGNYATPDSGRHTPTIEQVSLTDQGRRAELTVAGLKTGHVYDISVGAIGVDGPLWPTIAYYTLHRQPAAATVSR